MNLVGKIDQCFWDRNIRLQDDPDFFPIMDLQRTALPPDHRCEPLYKLVPVVVSPGDGVGIHCHARRHTVLWYPEDHPTPVISYPDYPDKSTARYYYPQKNGLCYSPPGEYHEVATNGTNKIRYSLALQVKDVGERS